MRKDLTQAETSHLRVIGKIDQKQREQHDVTVRAS
jgi:hypothetical protein